MINERKTADAYVVRCGRVTAGIVVAEQQFFRFYASESIFFPLDGQIFPSVGLAHKAVGDFMRLGAKDPAAPEIKAAPAERQAA